MDQWGAPGVIDGVVYMPRLESGVFSPQGLRSRIIGVAVMGEAAKTEEAQRRLRKAREKFVGKTYAYWLENTDEPRGQWGEACAACT